MPPTDPCAECERLLEKRMDTMDDLRTASDQYRSWKAADRKLRAHRATHKEVA